MESCRFREISTFQVQQREWGQVSGSLSKGGVGTESLQNLLKDETRQNDILISLQQGDEFLDGGMACRPPLAEGKRPDRCVDEDPHRFRRSALWSYFGSQGSFPNWLRIRLRLRRLTYSA